MALLPRALDQALPPAHRHRWPDVPARGWVSLDFFTVHTAGLRVLVVLAHHRRRFVHFNVAERPTAHWTAQETLSHSGSSARPGASASTAFSSSAKGTSTESWPAISRAITDKAADARTKQTISGATPEWIPDSGRAPTHRRDPPVGDST